MKEFFQSTEHVYQFVKGYSEWAVEESTEKYLAAITEAIEAANKEFDRNVDTDPIPYLNWLEGENE